MNRVTMKQIYKEVVRVFGEHTIEQIAWLTGAMRGSPDVTDALRAEPTEDSDAVHFERLCAEAEAERNDAVRELEDMKRKLELVEFERDDALKRLDAVMVASRMPYPDIHMAVSPEAVDRQVVEERIDQLFSWVCEVKESHRRWLTAWARGAFNKEAANTELNMFEKRWAEARKMRVALGTQGAA
jgi:hypothetical protein